MLLKDGWHIDLHTWHLHLHGAPEDLYGSNGFSRCDIQICGLAMNTLELNTTAVVLRVAADAASFTIAASKSVPYINSTSITIDDAESCA
jgi:hypothetical protein